jgi:hypothetical protein
MSRESLAHKFGQGIYSPVPFAMAEGCSLEHKFPGSSGAGWPGERTLMEILAGGCLRWVQGDMNRALTASAPPACIPGA